MGYSRTMSGEHRKKISDALKGRKHSIEHRNAISQGVKRAWAMIPPHDRTNEDIIDYTRENKI